MHDYRLYLYDTSGSQLSRALPISAVDLKDLVDGYHVVETICHVIDELPSEEEGVAA
jgi:hypothetical protein